ncbi:Rne/Rng family ribonuclease [Oxalobacter vibrioformis]|uniref:Ribonuclease E n=1 Tax=Oxalobacter vibrioformis TaxID=933080 RepID=A0A9E9P4F9_9BURK|nr:Rne/Rng family ribonuclease [Oxalobacter vibrioformis]WAW10051.1 Rne/Rng family ribonuclease [Oxalobacter vibrioformis]
MKRMLFNATQQEELRVAIVDGQKLLDIDIETAGKEQHKSNIYKAVITRIEPSLEACFVNYGEDRHGFLPFKEVVRGLFKEGVDVRNASIKDALAEGQEIMVQVEKEERGNKGAALTTFVSLAGRYLVLMPNNPRGGGVSRRVEGEERQELRENIDKLDLPPGMSVIARTAGIGRSVEELQWDLNYLLQLWRAIDGAGSSAPGAFLIYHESSLVIRAIRDYFQPDIGEILIDTDEIYEQARQFMSHVMPDMVNRVKRYRDDIPLFSRFQIEHQIETAYSRVVPLPSGGSIVIDHTEALVSIDVNSARSTRGGDIETTAFNTNCEAAEEAARQLRLRDLGGLIVIDFIDMEVSKNKREIENRLKDALRHDRARVQMDKISRFGLIELSRQRLRPALSEGSHITCPRCNGTGHIRDVDSFSLQVLRIIEEESMKESSAAIHIQLPVGVAAFLLNEKRGEVIKIEARHRVAITVIPNKYLETPRYKLERLKHDDPRLDDNHLSFELAEESTDVDMSFNKTQKEAPKPRQEALVKTISPDAPPPAPPPAPAAAAPVAAPASGGVWDKILAFFGIEKAEEEVAPPPKPSGDTRAKRNNGDRDRNRNRNRNRRGRDRNREDQAPETAIENTMDVVNDEMTMPKAPKQPRQPKEGGTGERKRNRRSGGAKGEQKEKAAATEEMELLDANNEVVKEPRDTGIIDASGPADAKTADTASGEDEPRRRRRRGGRNRNRRDRDSIADSAEVAEIVSGEAREIDELVDGLMADTLSQNDLAGRDVSEVATRDARVEDVAFRPVETVEAVVKEIPAENPRVTPVAFYDPNDEAVVDLDALPADNPAGVPLPVAEEVPVVAAEARTADASPETVALEVSDFLTAPVLDAEVTEETPVGEVVIEETIRVEEAVIDETPAEPEVIVVDEPVVEPETVVLAEPMEEAGVEVKPLTEAERHPMVEAEVTEDFSDVLASAGLTMAATDPEKLRQAQERAAQVAVEEEAPRPARRRRMPPPVADEPLVQVDTKK